MSIVRKIVSVVIALIAVILFVEAMTIPAIFATPYFAAMAVFSLASYIVWPKQPKVVYVKAEETK